MSKSIIPYRSPIKNLTTKSNLAQNNTFKKHRKNLFSELRTITGIPQIVNGLKQDELYKLVLVPEDATLYRDTAGNLKGVFYKDGKIFEHAKFKEVKPSFVKAATVIGSQIMLISIAMQLNRIEEGLQEISKELNDDRISEIKAGISQYNQALSVKDKNKQNRLIEHSIQTLNIGLEKTFKALERQICQLPDPESKLFDNWIRKKSKVAERKLLIAEESFYACLHGIKTLSECFIYYDEPELAREILQNNIERLSKCGIEDAAYKARLVPCLNGKEPEKPWSTFVKGESTMLRSINRYDDITQNKIKAIEIEFKPEELMERVR